MASKSINAPNRRVRAFIDALKTCHLRTHHRYPHRMNPVLQRTPTALPRPRPAPHLPLSEMLRLSSCPASLARRCVLISCRSGAFIESTPQHCGVQQGPDGKCRGNKERERRGGGGKCVRLTILYCPGLEHNTRVAGGRKTRNTLTGSLAAGYARFPWSPLTISAPTQKKQDEKTHPPVSHVDELDAAVAARRQLVRGGAVRDPSELPGVELGAVLLSSCRRRHETKRTKTKPAAAGGERGAPGAR